MVDKTVSKRDFLAFVFLFFIIPSKDVQVPKACWVHAAAGLQEKVVVVVWRDQIACGG